MKKLLFLVLSLFISVFAFSFHQQQGLKKGVEFISSYPRSGRNMTLALFKSLVHKDCIRIKNNESPSRVVRLHKLSRNSRNVLFVSHYFNSLVREIVSSENKLVVLVRNYKECIPRHVGVSQKGFLSRNEIKRYMKHIQFYEDWPNPKTKCMIFYEDMIKAPTSTFKKLLSFLGYSKSVRLGITEAKVQKTLDDSYKSYIRRFGVSKTSGGKTDLYHSKKAKKEDLIAVDQFIKMQYPDLWRKYLYRYETK